MPRTFFLWFAVGAALVAACAPDEGRDPANLVVILADDLGPECLGAFGGLSCETPRLDALAASGRVFRNAFAHPTCVPTRVSLLTGLHPFRTGWTATRGERRTFDPDRAVPIARLLREAGYATATAGKWRLGRLDRDAEHPVRCGFDEYRLWTWRTSDDETGSRYWSPALHENGEELRGLEGRYGPDLFCDFVVDFIERPRHEPFFVLIRGDHEASESKLSSLLKRQFRQATGDEVRRLTGASVGFVGPIGIESVPVFADLALRGQVGLITGANRDDYHYIGVQPDRDFKVAEYCDLRHVKAGDRCVRCGGGLRMSRAIELGHIFKLGTRYSEKMGAVYLDSEGDERPVVMGSYGIGLERILVAAIEQNADHDGIVWPPPLAPFHAVIVPLNMSDARIAETAEILYEGLGAGLEILYDDRDERAGAKFKDSDLIGVPLRVTVGGRGLERGVVELRDRKTGEVEEYAVDTAVEEIRKAIGRFFDRQDEPGEARSGT